VLLKDVRWIDSDESMVCNEGGTVALHDRGRGILHVVDFDHDDHHDTDNYTVFPATFQLRAASAQQPEVKPKKLFSCQRCGKTGTAGKRGRDVFSSSQLKKDAAHMKCNQCVAAKSSK
jgi:hypothetical protein